MRKFLSKTILFNLLIVPVMAGAMLWGLQLGLDKYTRQDQGIMVPNIVGMDYEQAQVLLSSRHLNWVLRDFDCGDSKGCLVQQQNPKPGTRVKEGRRVYLTMLPGQAPGSR